jgi:antitoxin YefM
VVTSASSSGSLADGQLAATKGEHGSGPGWKALEANATAGGQVGDSATQTRARYAEVLDGVVNDREEVVITRSGHEPVVIVSLEEFEALRETAYSMRSPANARRLLDAMERLESGSGQAHDLLDAD